MRAVARVVVVVVVALVVVPLAWASRVGPEPYRRPHVPLQWEQRRAVAKALERRAPVYCGGGRSNAVALTFDDGPGPFTEQVLSILRRNGAHATFFVVGNRLAEYPRAAREETQLGAVGDHSWSHARLTRLPRWLVWLELARTQWTLSQELGWKPRLFRAPYELHDRSTDGVARSLGLVEVFWSVIAGDDRPKATTKSVVRNVLAGLRPGAIVLMHDIHPWTARALPQILRAIRLRGLRAVSVPELLALDPPAPGRQCPSAPGSD
jgi:peptidoglycan/xylan/chitin deacetylase (PgdA/CDA1 family)